MPSAFVHPVRVYWEDTDAGGIVFYANQLKYFERARTEWLRALGVAQSSLREASGVMFIVSETRVRYLAAARLDDMLEVGCELTELGRASLALRQTSRRGATVVAEGDIRLACVRADTLAPCRLPPALWACLHAQRGTVA